MLLNVINTAEGFAWDGAICFLSDFFREAEVCFLSPEAADDTI